MKVIVSLAVLMLALPVFASMQLVPSSQKINYANAIQDAISKTNFYCDLVTGGKTTPLGSGGTAADYDGHTLLETNMSYTAAGVLVPESIGELIYDSVIYVAVSGAQPAVMFVNNSAAQAPDTQVDSSLTVYTTSDYKKIVRVTNTASQTTYDSVNLGTLIAPNFQNVPSKQTASIVCSTGTRPLKAR